MISLRGAHRCERGAVGGAEGLMFGMLILLGGTLAVLNLWTVVDTKASLNAAAREYLRTYTEQNSMIEARSSAEAAARGVLDSRGSRVDDLSIIVEEPNGFGPCTPVTVRIGASVRWFRVPFMDQAGSSGVSVESTELTDARREVITSDDYVRAATPCFGD